MMVRQRQQGEITQLPYCRSMGHCSDKSASFKQSERRRCKVTQHNAQQGRYHNVYSIKIFSKSSNLAYPARLRFRRSLLWNQRLFNELYNDLYRFTMSCPLGDLLPCCVPRAEHWLTLLPPFSMCVYCFGVPPGQLPIVIFFFYFFFLGGFRLQTTSAAFEDNGHVQNHTTWSTAILCSRHSEAQPCLASLCREQSIAVLHVVWFCTCPLSSTGADVVVSGSPPPKKKKKKKEAQTPKVQLSPMRARG